MSAAELAKKPDQTLAETIDVAFIHWIRPEMSFASVDDLVRRMDEDTGLARAALAREAKAFPPI